MILFKENKASQQYELTNEEIAQKFIDSPYKQKYLDSDCKLSLTREISFFICSSEGLNSSFDMPTNFRPIAEIILSKLFPQEDGGSK